MTFNVEERHAVMGSKAAMAVPTLADAAGMDQLLVSFGDAAFEGDRGSASFVTGVGFSVLGAGLILGATLSDIDDFLRRVFGG